MTTPKPRFGAVLCLVVVLVVRHGNHILVCLESPELGVELGTDARDFRFRDPRLGTEGLDEVVQLSRRDAVRVRLHDDGEQHPVDPPAALEDGGEEAPASQLRGLEGDIVGLGREQSLTVAVLLGRSRLSAFGAHGSDALGRLDLDELSEHEADRLPITSISSPAGSRRAVVESDWTRVLGVSSDVLVVLTPKVT